MFGLCDRSALIIFLIGDDHFSCGVIGPKVESGCENLPLAGCVHESLRLAS